MILYNGDMLQGKQGCSGWSSTLLIKHLPVLFCDLKGVTKERLNLIEHATFCWCAALLVCPKWQAGACFHLRLVPPSIGLELQRKSYCFAATLEVKRISWNTFTDRAQGRNGLQLQYWFTSLTKIWLRLLAQRSDNKCLKFYFENIYQGYRNFAESFWLTTDHQAKERPKKL